jgi:hypothetical protein
MNLGGMRALVKANDRFGDEYDSQIDGWLNDALRDVMDQAPSLVSEVTSGGLTPTAGVVTLPADLLRLRWVAYVTDSGHVIDYLTEIPLKQLEWDLLYSQGSEPSAWAWLTERTIRILPSSDRLIRVRYWQGESELLSDGQSPQVLPPQWHRRLLVPYALAEAYRTEDDPDMADRWLGQYERNLARFKAWSRRPSSTPRQTSGYETWLSGIDPGFEELT